MNPFERCLSFNVFLDLYFLFIEYICHDVKKVYGSILTSISCQTFAVYPKINNLLDMCLYLWCNNFKATFFLGSNLFDLAFSFIFTKNACFLCALCGRVTAFFSLSPKYTV